MEHIPAYHPGRKVAGSVKLSSNENPYGPSPAAMEAIMKHVAGIHVYPPVADSRLRERIALKRELGPEQVVLGNGSDEIFSLCAAALVEKGSNCVGSAHSFSQYEYATRLFDGDFKTIPMKNLRFDLDAILAAVDSMTRIVFLCSPNNPTGIIIPGGDLRDFMEKLPPGVLAVVDQAYGEYVDDATWQDAAALIADHPNLLVTGTFSKLYGLAALRIGYGLGQEELVSRLLQVKSPFNNSSLALEGAFAALDDHDFVRHSFEENRRIRQQLHADLTRIGLEHTPSEGNFICVRSPRGTAVAPVEALQHEGITVRDLSSFGLPEYLRITIGPETVMEKVLEILESLMP